MHLYHYTDYTSHSNIKRDRCLETTFTPRGKGVFFTTLNPEHSKEDIAYVCFQGGADTRLSNNKVDYYIELVVNNIETSALHFVKIREDVYKCQQTLYLDQVDSWCSGQFSSWSAPLVTKLSLLQATAVSRSLLTSSLSMSAEQRSAAVGGVGLAILGSLLVTGAEYYGKYSNAKQEKEEKLSYIERKLERIVSEFHIQSGSAGKNNQTGEKPRFVLVKKVDESRGYSFFGSPKGHIFCILCSRCKECISSPLLVFPVEVTTIEIIDRKVIWSELEMHRRICDFSLLKTVLFFAMLVGSPIVIHKIICSLIGMVI
jgi:hypothetical protein